MAVTIARNLAGCLVGLVGHVGIAAFGLGSTAMAGDSLPGAVFGAGAGAIIGHSVGGPDAAVVGGIIGAVTGAAVTSSHGAGVTVHYGPGYRPRYGHVPPHYYPVPPPAPVYVVPPPVVVFVPGRGHGFWHHGVDAWGRPLRSWVPAPRHRGYHAPAPRPHYYRSHRDGRLHPSHW